MSEADPFEPCKCGHGYDRHYAFEPHCEGADDDDRCDCMGFTPAPTTQKTR